ncbi:ABC transporter permease [Arcanobacterium phocisimile]|uniref:Cell division protein FtsX n=1 Tax=Arcanobacterium phocisimile TaxID=1302235 RepID=A0ABX7IGU2_9ACTO|nr:permease-like cell division protein FtsX [Arcanobacterium phocisimile]QRV01679.1 ABC transporter permease [Arcanobacterium phocisimile]
MRIGFIFSQVWKGLRKNTSMMASVVLVTFVSLLFVGAAILFQEQIESAKNDWYDKVEVSVFMCPPQSTSAACAGGEASEAQIEDLRAFLEDGEVSKHIEQIYFETKEDAYEAFRKQLEDTAWADTIDAELMQSSFRLKLTDPTEDDIAVVSEMLSGQPGVESVVDQREQLKPLFNMLNRFTLIATILAVIMIVVSVLLIPATIRLSAMFRRNETEIMRYVGASNAFIQAPFILEGVISSLIGALLAIGGLYVVVEFFVHQWFADSWLKIVSSHDVLMLAPWLLLAAIAISALASFLALRRYTRV